MLGTTRQHTLNPQNTAFINFVQFTCDGLEFKGRFIFNMAIFYMKHCINIPSHDLS